MPDVFFLVEERSDGVSKAGQVPQPVGACEPGLGDLSKLTAPTYLWGKVSVCHCSVFRGHVQLLKFVIVKIFWSCSNPKFGHIYSVM